jgi:hypothetical protein
MRNMMMDQMMGSEGMPQIPAKYSPPTSPPNYGAKTGMMPSSGPISGMSPPQMPVYGQPVQKTPPMGGNPWDNEGISEEEWRRRNAGYGQPSTGMMPTSGPISGMPGPQMPAYGQPVQRTNPTSGYGGGQMQQLQQMMRNPRFMQMLMRMFQQR